jgi:hypothetical protein
MRCETWSDHDWGGARLVSSLYSRPQRVTKQRWERRCQRCSQTVIEVRTIGDEHALMMGRKHETLEAGGER